jgi:Flp pilus assembly protein TadG
MPLQRRPGQALAETALCMPVLLALLLGIVDIGWLYNHQLMLTHAAREGARQGTLGQTGPQIRAGVKSTLQASGFSPLPTDAQIVVDMAGGKAKVTIHADVPALFAMSGPLVKLRAATEMRLD